MHSILLKQELLSESEMDKETVINVEHVSKKYCKSLKRSMLYGGIDISRNMLKFSSRSDRLRKDEFWALNDISFEVKKGEALGIIGPNGSGKTTLLKLLNGIFWPDKGKITIKGKVGALIELGAGFHPLLTGRENIYINAAILGMKKREIYKEFDSIVEFAGIGDFIDSPIKNYSSGMYVRLGFSIAIHSSPDILLVDEALSVGDAQFVQKCLWKFQQFQEKGGTIVFVSHNMDSIKKNCQETILLDQGEIIDRGKPKEVTDVYNALIFEKIASEMKKEQSPTGKELASRRVGKKNQRYGSFQAEIVDVTILNGEGKPRKTVNTNEATEIKIKALFYEELRDILVGFTIRNRIGVDVYMTNTGWKGVDIPRVSKNNNLEVSFAQKMCLVPGEYTITAAVSQITPNGIRRLDWVSDCLVFEVLASEKMSGICNLDSAVSVKQGKSEVDIDR